jgi:polyhydroxybutyrate depolymerase
MRFILLLIATLATGPAAACPGIESVCRAGDGAYRMALPEPPLRGLALFLHGWGGRADAQIREARVVEPLRARGYAVVAPQGAPRRPGDRGGGWNARADPNGRDDVAFLQAVIADARRRLDAPGLPVLAAGFSGGGMMVWRLACDAPGAAQAYAPVAGLLWRPLPQSCAGPVRLLHAHGWADPVVPLEGRSVAGGRITQGDLFAGLKLLRRTNSCARDDPDDYDTVGPFWRRHWRHCASSSALALALFPGGHVTPEGWADMALDWFEGAWTE